jgi:hypothetical protein
MYESLFSYIHRYSESPLTAADGALIKKSFASTTLKRKNYSLNKAIFVSTQAYTTRGYEAIQYR